MENQMNHLALVQKKCIRKNVRDAFIRALVQKQFSNPREVAA
jgi:hypothetical protein